MGMVPLTASADYGLSGQYIARINGRDSKYTFNREFLGRKGGKRNETSVADVDDPGIYECCDVERKSGKHNRFYFLLEVNGELHQFVTDKEDAMAVAKAMDGGRSFGEIVVGTLADPQAVEVSKGIKALKTLLIEEGSYDWIGRMKCPTSLTQSVGYFAAGAEVEQKDLQPVVRSEIDRLTKQLEALEAAGKHPKRFYEIVSAKDAQKKQAAQTIDTALEGCWALLQALPTKDARKVLAELKTKLTPAKNLANG